MKDYNVLFDIGYAGSPKYEFSIYNTDLVGYFEENLSTTKTAQKQTYSVANDASFFYQ